MSDQRGFTFFELVILVVVLAILLAVGIPKYLDMRAEANASACKTNQAVLERAIALYIAENTSAPSSLTDLAPYLAGGSLPSCPSGGTYSFVAGTGNSQITCSVSDHAR